MESVQLTHNDKCSGCPGQLFIRVYLVYEQLNIIVVECFAALTNVAPGKPALQSSTDAGHVAEFAVDGDITTCAVGNTRDHQWLLVDLRYQYEVAEVIIVTWENSGKLL